MSEERKEPAVLKIIATIIVPITAFLVGMVTQYFISERSLAFQRFTRASDLMLNESAQKNKELRGWSEAVIAQYTKEIVKRERTEPPTVSRPSDAVGIYWVTDAIADDVCLVPKAAREPLPKMFMMDKEKSELVGQDAKLLLMKAFADYSSLEGRYDLIMDILDQTCGFTTRREGGRELQEKKSRGSSGVAK